jgi:hypothetical protein
MQRRFIEAHARQSAAPLLEVEQLLKTMLEGWREAAERGNTQEVNNLAVQDREAYGRGRNRKAFAQPTAATSHTGSESAETQLYAVYLAQEHLGQDHLGQDQEAPASPVFSF